MNLHNQIMNLRVAPTELATSLYAGDTTLAYKIGHRDARHAAAELALAADAEIERLRLDAERLDFLMRAVSDAEFSRIGIFYSAGCTRENIDTYRTPSRTLCRPELVLRGDAA